MGRRFPPAPGAERRHRQRRPRRPRRRRGRLARRLPPHAGEAAIPDRQERSFSPGGSLASARPGSGGPRWSPPPRFSGLLTTKRCRRRSRRPRPASPAPGRRRLPRRECSPWRSASDLGRGRPSLRGRGGEGEALAAWLADAVLAERLNWPFALPMLAAQLLSRRSASARRAISPTAPKRPACCSPTPKRRRRPAISRLNLADARKNCFRRRRSCAPRGQGRRCGRCSTTTCSAPRRQNRRALRARRATAVRPAGCARRGPRTDRTGDVPALRALSDGADPET